MKTAFTCISALKLLIIDQSTSGGIVKRSGVIFLLAILVICAGTAYAGTRRDSGQSSDKKKASGKPDIAAIHSCLSCHSITKEEAGAVFKGIGEVLAVKASPAKGLYEVTVKNNNRQVVAYLDFGKKYLVSGPVFDIATRTMVTPPPVDLPKKISKEQYDKIPTNNSIIMGKPDGRKRLFVFTDPDCPFCSRLHAELKKLVAMEPDLVVYIKMFPLKMHPAAYDKARVILGANSLEMLDKAFAGEKLPQPGEKDAKEPVDETIRFGASLGIDGTPAIVLPDGMIIAGYKDANTLRKLMAGPAEK
jgi:thiol:disulfide interchange protein DsbC